ncbi:MAG TPA: hypothetical protein PLB63_04955 [Planctomycetota bacterium]|nr:hypothetical protein [Planctomycetota bacterium]
MKYKYTCIILFFFLLSCTTPPPIENTTNTNNISQEKIDQIQQEIEQQTLISPNAPIQLPPWSIQTNFQHYPDKPISFELMGYPESDLEIHVYLLPNDQWIAQNIIFTKEQEVQLSSSPLPPQAKLLETYHIPRFTYPLHIPSQKPGIYCIEIHSMPQTIRFPIYISNIVAVPIQKSTKQTYWLFHTKTNKSLHNHTFQNTTNTITTDELGILHASPTENNIFYTTSPDFAAILLYPDTISYMILDRLDYSPAEEIILHSSPKLISSSLHLINKNNQSFECTELVANQPFLQYKIPADITSGTYLLQLSTGQQQYIQIIPPKKPIPDYIHLEQTWISQNETIQATLWTTREKKATLQLHLQTSHENWELIDTQTRHLNNQQAIFYFRPPQTGNYKLTTTETETFFCVQSTEKFQHTPQTLSVENSNTTLQIIQPYPTLWTITDQNALIHYSIESKPYTITSYISNPHIHFYFPQDQQILHQQQNFPKICKNSIITKQNKPTNIPYKNALTSWAEIASPLTQIKAPYIPLKIKATSTQNKIQYSIWQKHKLQNAFIQAKHSQQLQDHSKTLQSCLEILQIAPQNQTAKKILHETWQKLYPNEEPLLPYSSNPIQKLQCTRYTHNKNIKTLENFLTHFSHQTGVYLEYDPQIVAQPFFIEDLPANEPALDILEYVLQKNELQYIIQEQILLITNKQNIHQNLLQSIGNQNMVSAPPKQLPTTKIYPTKITNENIQYTFPFPCIWFLHTTTTKHNQSIHEITPVIVLEK